MNSSIMLRPLTVLATAFALSACGAESTGDDFVADSELNAADPTSWNTLADLRGASGAYRLRSPIYTESLALCPLYTVVTVDERRTTVFFEQRPLYYELDPRYVSELRSQRASGMRTEMFNLHRSAGGKLRDGVLTGKTSPYAGNGTSTLAFSEKEGSDNLHARYSVADEDASSRWAPLVCEYERIADTMKEMADVVIDEVELAWTGARSSIVAMSDGEIDDLCAVFQSDTNWVREIEWTRGFCDGDSAATNRPGMIQALDDALWSLAKERRGLVDPVSAYGGETIGQERLYQVSTNRAVFGGFAPTDVYAEQVELALRKERCEEAGLTTETCQSKGTLVAALLTRYHDR